MNYSDSLDDHDPQHKVGVITAAWIDGNKVMVKGDIWKRDFPESIQDIKGKSGLGMSMELGDVRVRDVDANTWVLDDFSFTGATILKRERAAYWKTSVAASSDSKGGTEMDDKDKKATEVSEALIAAISAGIEKAVAPAFKTLTETNGTLMKALENVSVSMGESQKNILAAIEAMKAKAADDDASSTATSTATATGSGSASKGKKEVDAGGKGKKMECKGDKDKKSDVVDIAAAAATISKLEARVGELETEVEEKSTRLEAVEAQGKKFALRIERKSMTPELSALLEKGGINISEVLAAGTGGRKPLTVTDVDLAFERSNLNLTATDRMNFKNQLLQLGAMEDGAVRR